MSKSNANLLGYYFIIFQSNLNGYVKCWLDGSESYTYYVDDDFIGLFEKINSDKSLIYKALDCLNTTGIYLWDIDKGKINRLTNKYEAPSLTQEITKINPLNKKVNKDIIERRIF